VSGRVKDVATHDAGVQLLGAALQGRLQAHVLQLRLQQPAADVLHLVLEHLVLLQQPPRRAIELHLLILARRARNALGTAT
jgi:hypothetical protein